MTLGTIALAVTLGSIIGMAAILWNLHQENKRANARADYLDNEACRYLRKYAEAKRKLARFDRTRGDKGKFVKKEGS